MGGLTEFHYSLGVRAFVSVFMGIVMTIGIVGNLIVCVSVLFLISLFLVNRKISTFTGTCVILFYKNQ